MEGFDVVTSDDCKFGQVVAVQDGHLIVEHGTLRRSKYAVPATFVHTAENEQTVRVRVPKDIIEASPKIENGSIDTEAVAIHYGLAEGAPGPETEGDGDVLPDDPARSADPEAVRAGRETAGQPRAAIPEGGLRPQPEGPGPSPA